MLRKFLLSSVTATAMAGSALAADLPSRKAPPVAYAPPVFTWTGFYIGVQGGYAWENIRETGIFGGLPIYTLSNNNARGFLGGGHVGFNWQVAQVVFGMEGDVEGSGVRGTSPTNPFFDGALNNVSWRADIRGSIRGRLGLAFDRALLYATGGVAFTTFKMRENFFGLGLSEAFNTSRAGFTVGAGLEYAFTNNWTARVEYRFTDFGTFNNASVLAPGLFYRERVFDQAIRGGISYKFDYAAPAPVVARY
ncbi:MAG: porin family protein [Beijerinckiaceae bacterium]